MGYRYDGGIVLWVGWRWSVGLGGEAAGRVCGDDASAASPAGSDGKNHRSHRPRLHLAARSLRDLNARCMTEVACTCALLDEIRQEILARRTVDATSTLLVWMVGQTPSFEARPCAASLDMVSACEVRGYRRRSGNGKHSMHDSLPAPPDLVAASFF